MQTDNPTLLPSNNPLIKRQQATFATLNKYRNKPFSWKEATTCVHMLRYHLRQLGYKPEPMPRVRSSVAAKRALSERGCDNLSDLLDTLLTRIPHAQALTGDVVVMKSDDGFGSIAIVADNKVIGWHDSHYGMTVMVPLEIEGAWRV